MIGNLLDRPGRQFILLSLAICAAILLFGIWKYRFFLHNDMWITMRYVVNFVELGDLSWNPGDRVEGYTEPLHLLLLSGLIWAGAGPVMAAQGFNVICAILLWAAVYRGARKLSGSATPGLVEAVTLLAVVTAPPVIIWIFGGLGALLAATLSAWAVVVLIPAFDDDDCPNLTSLAAISGVLFALAYLARPDAVVVFAACCLGVFLAASAPFDHRFRAAFVLGIIPVAVIVAHLIWRFAYYGELMPNTYYAKVGLDRSVRWAEVPDYIRQSFSLYLMPVSLGIIGGIYLLVRSLFRPGGARLILVLLAAICLHTAYVAWSGGDHMPAARVLLPVLAPGCLLLAHTLSRTAARYRPALALAVSIPMLISVFAAPRIFEDGASWVGSIVGPYIDRTWPKDALVATNSAGALVFFARDRSFIDMLGLNDRTIGKRADIELVAPKQFLNGHSKGDGAYVLSRQPDYIIVGRAQGMPSDVAWYLSGHEMHRIDEFHDCYEVHAEEIPYRDDADPLPFVYYKRVCDK